MIDSRKWAALAALALGLAPPLAAPVRAQQPASTAARPPARPAPDAPRPLSLEEALHLAQAQSEDVRIAKAGVLRARGQQYQARAAFLPQLNASVNYQRTLQSQFEEISERFAPPPDTGTGGSGDEDDLANNPLAKIFASEQQIQLGLQLSQPLFAGGRLSATRRAANAGRRAADIGLTAAEAQLKLDVAQAYYNAVLSERLYVIADSSLVLAEDALRQTRLARQVGNTSEFTYLQAQVTRDNQRPTVIQARTQRDLALLRLKQLLDLPLDADLELTTDIHEGITVPGVRLAAAGTGGAGDALAGATVAPSDTAAEERSSVRQAAAAVEAQESYLRITRAQRLPSVSLSSQYGRTGYPDGGLPPFSEFFPNWTVSVGAQFPLFTGGRIRGEELVARANVVEARERLVQAREFAALDARQALAQLEQAAAAWRASAGTAEQAGRAYTIAGVRYREGISTQLELTQARIQLQQAQANRAVAARDLQVARIRLALLRDLPLDAGGVAGSAGGQGAGQGTAPPEALQRQLQQRSQPQAQGAGGFPQTSSTGSPTQ